MNLNREKIAAALALVLLIAGLYRVTVGVITPRPDIRVPDTRLPEQRREIAAPRFPYSKREEVVARDPFSFSEGWRRLDRLPLAPPPVPAPALVLPRIGRGDGGAGGAAGLVYTESVPAAAPAAGDEAGATGGSP